MTFLSLGSHSKLKKTIGCFWMLLDDDDDDDVEPLL